jgi:multicomponent Na+:H+ antiporter subunit F
MSIHRSWLNAAILLLIPMTLTGWTCFRVSTLEKLPAVQLSGSLASLLVLIYAVAVDRSIYVDVALSIAILSYGTGMLLARAMERWF